MILFTCMFGTLNASDTASGLFKEGACGTFQSEYHDSRYSLVYPLSNGSQIKFSKSYFGSDYTNTLTFGEDRIRFAFFPGSQVLNIGYHEARPELVKQIVKFIFDEYIKTQKVKDVVLKHDSSYAVNNDLLMLRYKEAMDKLVSSQGEV
ncbi:MAG: hypothetical protein H6850_02905 [Alphaproteobacteria bacterium]|nr:MAG: hypothetical protein H6850_02905 [Alphaproteobacteria bacterium]